MINPSNSKSLFYYHIKAMLGKAKPGVGRWHLKMPPWEVMGKGCRGKGIQPSSQGRWQGQLPEAGRKRCPPSSSHISSLLQDNLPTVLGAAICNACSRKGHVCTLILLLHGTQCFGVGSNNPGPRDADASSPCVDWSAKWFQDNYSSQ